MVSGTFTYKFDFTGSPPLDVSSNLPIINGNGSFTTLTQSYSVVGNTITVNIAYVFVDNGTTIDGLTFANVYGYYNDVSFSALTVTNFGSIPLSRNGNQFSNLSSLVFTSTDPPTILPNTRLEQCFLLSATFNSPINNWDTTNVTNFRQTFYGASSFNQPISNWNISNANSVYNMFQLSAFDQDLSAWGSTLPTDLNELFVGTNFTGSNPNIGGWNTSNVTIMSNMFVGSNFNNDISSWDTSNVTNMVGMFYNASSFNKDISLWNVSNVTNMSFMFNLATSFSPTGSNTNLDKLLNSWASQPVQSGVTLAAPNSYYSASGLTAYNTLVNNPPGWTISAIFSDVSPVPPSNTCFPAKTIIRTDQGMVSIKNLDKTYHTIHGKAIIHVTKIVSEDKHLIEIPKSSIGKNMPDRDMLISRNHKVLYRGTMMKARDLPGVKQVEYSGETLFNVLLENPGQMVANGLIVETLNPDNGIARLYRDLKYDQLSFDAQKMVLEKIAQARAARRR